MGLWVWGGGGCDGAAALQQPPTCIVTLASVWMYTSSFPALLSGESSSIMRHWWQMSGLYLRAMCYDEPVMRGGGGGGGEGSLRRVFVVLLEDVGVVIAVEQLEALPGLDSLKACALQHHDQALRGFLL